MIPLAVLATLGSISLPLPEIRVSGRSTIYYYGDRHSGNHLASCNGIDPITHTYPCRRCFFLGQKHIAHRSIALRTVGTICNHRTKLCTRVKVMDRGPFGALRHCSRGRPKDIRRGRYTFKPRRIRWAKNCFWWQAQPGGLVGGFEYRGEFDMTPAVAKEIGHRAFDQVTFKYRRRRWRRKKKKQLLSYSFYEKIKFPCTRSIQSSLEKWMALRLR